MQKRPVEVLYFDGIAAVGRTAYIQPVNSSMLQLSYGEQDIERIEIPYKTMQFIGAVGRRPPVVELPDDARIEFMTRVPHWFNKPQKQIYHWIWVFERSPARLLIATFLAVFLAFSIVKWGIPWMAMQLANIIPDNTVQNIGHETERRILAQTEVSTLSQDYQQYMTQRFQQEIAEPNQMPAKLIFRQGASIGANAMAIPNNTIIVTDELVQLAGNDEEVLAVLAHEQGHLVRKHAMQKIITASSIAFTWELINHDGSSLISSAAVALSHADYSKRLERDADDYAMRHLHANGLSSIHLSNFLQRVENIRLSQPEKTEHRIYTFNPSTWLQTHPDEEERIQTIHAFAAAQAEKAQSQ